MKDIFRLIPDIYYDWYARFLPGVAGIAALISIQKINIEFCISNILITGLIAYATGHFFQSPASYLTRRIEKYVKCDPDNTFIKNRNFEKYANLIRLIGKAHAEATGIASSGAILLAVFIFYLLSCAITKDEFAWKNVWIIGVVPLLILMVFERVHARKRKIRQLKLLDGHNNRLHRTPHPRFPRLRRP